MAVLYLSLGSPEIYLHASFTRVSIRSMQYVLVDLQYDEASSYSILTPIF